MSVDCDRTLSVVSFDGRDGESVSDLLRSVKRVALAGGQHQNDEWLIHYTESCLGESALEWFLDLDQSVQQSWPALQKALLRHFKSDQVTTGSTAASDAFRSTAAMSYMAPVPMELGPDAFKAALSRLSYSGIQVGNLDATRNFQIVRQNQFSLPGVGKSCLLARWTSQVWAPYIAPTVGVDYAVVYFTINDRTHVEHLWDPSGKKEYDDIREKYYKGIKNVWLVYDVTNRQSFENLRVWRASLQRLAPEITSAHLYGCKVDLADKRAVWPYEAEALAKELGAWWDGESSAKTNQGPAAARARYVNIPFTTSNAKAMSVEYDRSSASPLEQISFNGEGGEDVTEFLRNVKRVALAEGHQRDDDWMIDYVESCLAGPALKWLLDQDDNEPASFRGLQRAMISRFESAQPTPSAPQPAPAAGPPRAPLLALRPVESGSALSFPAPPAFGQLETPTSSRSAPPLPSDFGKSQKYLILGDSGVGKSCLLVRFLSQAWIPNMAPTVEIHYETRWRVTDGSKTEQHFWDISGSQRHNDRLNMYYNDVDYVWVIYDVTNRRSFENVRGWVATAWRQNPRLQSTRMIGNKSDLRDERTVSYREGEALAQQLNIKWGGETSAFTNSGVQMAFGSWAVVSKQLG
ncbi:GTP-binding protein [Tulasnella sp. 331]|nr:GTP-binding protein [Tulasnella sp. 331]